MNSLAIFAFWLVLGLATAEHVGIERTDIVGPSGSIHRDQPVELEAPYTPEVVATGPGLYKSASYNAYPYSAYPYSASPYSAYPYSAYPYSSYPYSSYPYSSYPYSSYPSSGYPYATNYPYPSGHSVVYRTYA